MNHTKVGEDFGLGIHNVGDDEELYNPTHYSSIAAGAEEFPLLEEHFGNTFAYDAPPSNASSPPPHIREPAVYYPPSADHSPGSSAGEIDQPTDSRGSSVTSFHPSPRTQLTAPPGFNESLANLNFGAVNADSSELYIHQISSPGIISAPIDAPSPPPSATSPPPHHGHNKSLTQ